MIGQPPAVLPDVNALVEVVLTDTGASFLSRVEDVVDGDLVVAGPPGAVTRDLGFEVVLSWAVERGRLEQTARLVADRHDAQRTWRVRMQGETRRSNRRSYVRVSLAFPLTVAARGATVPGAGVDVSEGGLRCRVRAQDGHDQRDIRAIAGIDAEVTLRFALEGEDFTMPGAIVRSVPLEDGGRELGIRFVGTTASLADRIRRVVFAVERRQRANGVLR